MLAQQLAKAKAVLFFCGAHVVEAAVALQALVTAIQKLFGLEINDLAQCLAQCALELCGHLLVIGVRAAHRLVSARRFPEV